MDLLCGSGCLAEMRVYCLNPAIKALPNWIQCNISKHKTKQSRSESIGRQAAIYKLDS